VTFDTANREVRVECWPRYADPTDGPEGQYAGWPITVAQADGDGRTAAAALPELDIRGLDQPVVQVVDESNGETLYTLRLATPTFRPSVFRDRGTYTVRIGDGEQWLETLTGVQALPPDQRRTQTVEVSTG